MRTIPAVLLAMSALSVSTAHAQPYPSKSIRLVIPFAVGGGADILGRLFAQKLYQQTGQTVVADTRAGAGGNLGAEITAKSPADGYTVMFTTNSLAVNVSLYPKQSYNAITDLTPVALVAAVPLILVVHPSVAVKSARELIDLAKAKPGALNYSSGQSGSSSHLAAELFKYMANVNIVGIHYKSGATRMTDLIGGQVQMEFATPGAVAAHVKSGKLRPLAVTSAQPSALVPGLPTVSATGLPGYESVGMSGVYAPAKTPVSIVNLLSKEIARVVNQPDIKQKFFETGVEAVGGSPAELAAKIKSELERMGKVIKAAGIRGES